MNVTLRRFEPEDAKKVVQYLEDQEVFRYLSDNLPYPYSLQRGQQFVEAAQENFPLDCAIVVDGEFAGTIGLMEKNDVYRCNMEIGYWLGRKYWNRGVITEAIRQMCNVAFGQEGITRVYAVVFAENLSSAKALERNGFLLEGRHRNGLIKYGVVHDALIYGLTWSDWAARKRG